MKANVLQPVIHPYTSHNQVGDLPGAAEVEGTSKKKDAHRLHEEHSLLRNRGRDSQKLGDRERRVFFLGGRGMEFSSELDFLGV